MFNKEKEIDFLEKNIKSALAINTSNLDFASESALIRYFEVIGGIGKQLERYGSKTVKNNLIWKAVISMRDKISHSYYSLRIEPLLNAVKDLNELLITIPMIREELK